MTNNTPQTPSNNSASITDLVNGLKTIKPVEPEVADLSKMKFSQTILHKYHLRETKFGIPHCIECDMFLTPSGLPPETL
jgi:hypothetical protein